jgi:hypothetical protein
MRVEQDTVHISEIQAQLTTIAAPTSFANRDRSYKVILLVGVGEESARAADSPAIPQPMMPISRGIVQRSITQTRVLYILSNV